MIIDFYLSYSGGEGKDFFFPQQIWILLQKNCVISVDGLALKTASSSHFPSFLWEDFFFWAILT